jgi:hypothetical protein
MDNHINYEIFNKKKQETSNIEKMLNHDKLFNELSESSKLEYLAYLQNLTRSPIDANDSKQPSANEPLTKPLTNDVKTRSSVEEVEVSSLQDAISDYIKKNNPKLYILTPCYGSLCYVNYVVALMTTVDFFNKIGFPLQIEFCRNDSLVSRARNNLLARAMNDPLMTHVLFIDSDITWDPLDILKLIIDDKPLNGGVYPLKKYNWSNLIATQNAITPPNQNMVKEWIDKKNESPLKNFFTDEDFIQAKLLRYNINYLHKTLNIEKNLAQVRHIANGFMMIQRSVINTMIKAYPETKYNDDVGFLKEDENKYAYALFDCCVEDHHYLSEDWYFCNRWSKLGGIIYINVSINLTHTGNEDFKGSYIASLIA